MDNLRSPSLAGIISDPADAARRMVPASTRPDGSTRKQLRVRPGYVPTEDVAKFKVGQGSMKQQLASARENHQAPSTPSSPAVNNANVQVKRPSDFVPKEPRMYPQKQQQQQQQPAATPFKSGATTSRWASTPSTSAAAAAAPATPVRITKQPVQAAPTVTQTPAAVPEQAKSQEMSSRTPSLSTPATAPATTLKFSPSGSDLPPDLEGEWWDDELDSTADALQGINLDSVPIASTSASPVASKEQPEARKQSPKQQKQPQQASQSTEQVVLSVKGRGKGKANGAAPEQRQNGRKERQKSQSGQVSLPMQRGRSNEKTQQGPPASAPPASQGFPARTEQTSGIRTGLARLSLTEITERARVLGNDLREARQLKRYASSGAVLKPEQTTKLQDMDDTLYELEQLRDVLRNAAEEVEKSMADGK